MNQRLALINRNTLESLEEIDAEKIIEKFTQTGMQILKADFGFMFWKLENENTYKIAYVSPGTPYKPKQPRKRGYNYKASEGKLPYFVSSPIASLRPYMESLAIIPIFYKSHQYGNIVLCFRNKRIFTPEEAPLMTTLGNSAAQVLTIHRSHKKSENEYLRQLRQKDEFFNVISHELKTPVTTIKGYSQMLSDILQNNDKQTRSFLEKINKHADKLTRLINDMFDVSRIETGKLIFENRSFELEKLAKQTIEGMKIAIKSHEISFKSSGKFWVRGDSHRIEAVIINLINNAAKYSPAGTKIKVCLTECDKKACIEVEDFGYGISEQDKEKIFKRFYQNNDSNKKNLAGLGLGLYIANSIVKHHGGSLSFRSKAPKAGTIFFFTVPYYKCRMKK